MPDSLTQQLIRRLGINMPEAPQPTPEQEELHQQLVGREQAKDSPLRKAAQQMLLAPGEAISGLFSDPIQDLTPEQRNPAFAVGALGAALPFGPKGIKGMYSKAERLAEGLPKKVPVKEWMGILKNRARVHPEEVRWRGLDKLGEGRTEPIGRDEIIRQLEENPLDVKVIEYDKQPRIIGHDMGGEPIEAYPYRGRGTTYDNYQMPGASNYRETLIQLPPKQDISRYGYIAPDSEAAQAAGVFRDPHWDEPNPLVGVRHNERMLPTADDLAANAENIAKQGYSMRGSTGLRGRMIENIQSGWQQRGQHAGFGSNAVASNRIAERELARSRFEAARLARQVKADEITGNPGVDPRYVQGRFGDPEDPLIKELSMLQVEYDNALDAVQRLSTDPVPDMPYRNTTDPVRLGLRQQLLDIAHNRPDLEWLGIAPSSELRARGEVIHPRFQDETVPRVLEEELGRVLGKPVPAREAMWVRPQQTDLGIRSGRPPNYNFNPAMGRYGGFYTNAHDVGDLQAGIVHMLPGADRGALLNQLEQQRPNVQAPIVKLTPDMLKLIRERGFPIATIMAMLQARESGQQASGGGQ